MKNVVITFHREVNYGAVLQSYALQRTLSKYGETYLLDYSMSKKRSKKSLKSIIFNIIEKIKSKKMVKFLKKNCNFTRQVKNIEQIENECGDYDNIICGSDQVWAKDITKNDMNIYSLGFKVNKKAKKISYAASLGKEDVKKEEIKELLDNLKNYSAISVRETSAKEILNKHKVENVVVTLDPTLLLSKDEWNKVIQKDKENKTEYIFVYMLEIDDKIIKSVKHLKKLTGLNIICLNTLNHFGEGTICKPFASPEEFITYIKNAKYVVTNSFHGTCFSIIYNKNFGVILHSTKSTRQQEILTKLNLTDVIINNDIEKILSNKIDYKAANQRLIELRDESINFIEEAIGDE